MSLTKKTSSNSWLDIQRQDCLILLCTLNCKLSETILAGVFGWVIASNVGFIPRFRKDKAWRGNLIQILSIDYTQAHSGLAFRQDFVLIMFLLLVIVHVSDSVLSWPWCDSTLMGSQAKERWVWVVFVQIWPSESHLWIILLEKAALLFEVLGWRHLGQQVFVVCGVLLVSHVKVAGADLVSRSRSVLGRSSLSCDFLLKVFYPSLLSSGLVPWLTRDAMDLATMSVSIA